MLINILTFNIAPVDRSSSSRCTYVRTVRVYFLDWLVNYLMGVTTNHLCMCARVRGRIRNREYFFAVSQHIIIIILCYNY